MKNICIGCGVSLDKSNQHWCSVSCYQKHYQKKYYELNADKLRKYGCEYFQKNKVRITNDVRIKRLMKRGI